MAQKTFTSAVLTATDINTYLSHEGGAWTNWSPVVTQTNTPTLTNNHSAYARAGRCIDFDGDLTITSNGTASAAVTVTLPVTAAISAGLLGSGLLFDSSAGLYYPFFLVYVGTGTAGMYRSAAEGTATPAIGQGGFTAALANADRIWFTGRYQSAT
jgi:hypothetical protein